MSHGEFHGGARLSGAPFPSFTGAGAEPFVTTLESGTIIVRHAGKPLLRLRLEAGAEWVLSALDGGDPTLRRPATLAALEFLTAERSAPASLRLDAADWADDANWLLERGIATAKKQGALTVQAEALWQIPDPWLPRAGAAAFPLSYRLTDGKRHPLRPPKPVGTVYSRFIPWLGQSFSLRAASLGDDLETLHRWMNDPRVAQFWNEDGDLEHHRRYLGGLLADPHMLPLIGCFDGVPFAYFEIYWAKENRLGPYYDANDFDRGWHVVVGEDAYRGRSWLAAWLPSLVHWMFLDECRTQRIVGEPQADHHQQIRNLDRSGFAKVKEFDFPHKRAMLVMLLRERFFTDRLWAPDFTSSAAPQTEALRHTAPLQA